MEELRRQAGWAKTFGLPLELISAEEAKELFPLMSTEGVLGAAWLPTDGYIDPSQLTYALADGARRGGCRIFTSTRVTGIEVRDGRVRGVRDRPRATSRPRSWSTPAACSRPRSRRMAGVRVPLIPMSPPVPRHPAVPASAREKPLPDPARPRPADLLPRGRRRAGDGRLRAAAASRPSCPTARPARADPARLQRPPARRGLGPLRGDHRELQAPGAGDGRDHRDQTDQRARGLHPRQRVLPRRDRGRAASSSAPASAPTASPAPAGSAK